MKSVKPIYIVFLVAVLVLFFASKLLNPNKKYSTRQYWETATLESVREVPEAALKKGNRNGPVLMWASTSTSNSEIIKALVKRGADINERDVKFGGTALTGAASYSKNPEIIRELIKSGADKNVRAVNGATTLMIAAMYNNNPGIIEELILQGADIGEKNVKGEAALDLARTHDNKTAEKALLAAMPGK